MVNKRVLLGISMLVLCIGVGLGCYFIGYNIGYETMKEDLKRMDGGIAAAYATTAPAVVLEGAYKRSFYDYKNNSAESYIVFGEDGGCKYVNAISVAGAISLDLSSMDEKCSYTYDEEQQSGEIIVHDYFDQKFKFSFKNNVLTVGAATYYKIQN